jgi:RNA polymerase sporulation-specific sigma factor
MFLQVSGGGSFPKTLSPEEEKHYLELLEHGDEEERKRAKEELISRNLRLVAHIVKKYNAKDSEDLISIGTIGLIKGIITFNPSRGTKLATYASRCIENAILT